MRRTPMLQLGPLRDPGQLPPNLYCKLELLQVSGSFKARGAMNKLLTLPAEKVARGLGTASGGNHGLGVAYAGWTARVPVTIYLPNSTPRAKAEKLAAWGAEVRWAGTVWDDANAAALAAAEREGWTYVHPFADPAVIAGQGTLGLEILEEAPTVDTVVVAIGGGGLIAGVATALKALRPEVRVIGVEPTGAPTLHDSVRAGHLVELERIATAAGTLAPRRSAEINLAIVRRLVDDIVLVTDDEMREAARWIWRELGVGVELSGAAALAALLAGRLPGERDRRVCALLCGAGSDGIG
ncbi:MAG TPA: threonine/serine dehydratase [Polyangia bacterium]|nr:threonine/serine dehydratase [Polyangia bacterium]